MSETPKRSNLGVPSGPKKPGDMCCGPAMERGEDGALHVFDCAILGNPVLRELRMGVRACEGAECAAWREHYAGHGITGEAVP